MCANFEQRRAIGERAVMIHGDGAVFLDKRSGKMNTDSLKTSHYDRVVMNNGRTVNDMNENGDVVTITESLQNPGIFYETRYNETRAKGECPCGRGVRGSVRFTATNRAAAQKCGSPAFFTVCTVCALKLLATGKVNVAQYKVEFCQ